MKKSILGVAKNSWTVYSSGVGIAGIIGAIAMGQMDPLVGGIAIAFGVAVIFLRRAVGDSTVDLGHALIVQVANAVDKEAGGDLLVSTKKVKAILEAADPDYQPHFQGSKN